MPLRDRTTAIVPPNQAVIHTTRESSEAQVSRSPGHEPQIVGNVSASQELPNFSAGSNR